MPDDWYLPLCFRYFIGKISAFGNMIIIDMELTNYQHQSMEPEYWFIILNLKLTRNNVFENFWFCVLYLTGSYQIEKNELICYAELYTKYNYSQKKNSIYFFEFLHHFNVSMVCYSTMIFWVDIMNFMGYYRNMR